MGVWQGMDGNEKSLMSTLPRVMDHAGADHACIIIIIIVAIVIVTVIIIIIIITISIIIIIVVITIIITIIIISTIHLSYKWMGMENISSTFPKVMYHASANQSLIRDGKSDFKFMLLIFFRNWVQCVFCLDQ